MSRRSTAASGTRPLDLLCVGHLNLDHEVSVRELPAADRTVPIEHHAVYLGGTAGNVARWSAHLGVRTGISAFIGSDFPSEFRTLLEQEGVDLTRVAVRPGMLTPTCWIARDASNRQFTFIDQAAMADTGAEPLPSLKGVGWVHLNTGDPVYQLRVARLAQKHGIHVSADPAQEIHYRWSPRQLEELLRLSEILFGNHHELRRAAQALGVARTEGLIEKVPLVVETRGERGALAHFKGGSAECPAFPVRTVRSVTGAGDAFRGGFYAGWFAGLPLEQCLRSGCRAGAEVVRRKRSLFLPIESRSGERKHDR